jgi:hypothetical protein
MRNDNGYSGVVMGVFILIIVAVGAMSFLMITEQFNIQYDNVINDPINNTGIMVNNTSGYEAAKVMSEAMSDNLFIGIILAMLLLVIIILGYVYTMSKV